MRLTLPSAFALAAISSTVFPQSTGAGAADDVGAGAEDDDGLEELEAAPPPDEQAARSRAPNAATGMIRFIMIPSSQDGVSRAETSSASGDTVDRRMNRQESCKCHRTKHLSNGVRVQPPAPSQGSCPRPQIQAVLPVN